MIVSHLSACKCAIDLKATQKAKAELESASSLVESHPDCRADLRGYLLLFSGELAVQEEDRERGLDLMDAALTHFEGMDPPHYPGILDSKIGFAQIALIEGDFKLATIVLHKLLAEAEERNCLDARSRLLALETCLYVTDSPPLRAAFDDLVTRVQLINNPAVLFRALGNLYTHALEYLDQQEQAQLLRRIKGLKKVLEASCYEDLYRNYVTERYEYAIENRLARFVDEEWVVWDENDEPSEDNPSEADDRS